MGPCGGWRGAPETPRPGSRVWNPAAQDLKAVQGGRGGGRGQGEVGPGNERPGRDEPGFWLGTGTTLLRGWGRCRPPHTLLPLPLDPGLPGFLSELMGCSTDLRWPPGVALRPQWALEGWGQAMSCRGILLGWPQGCAS